MIRIRGRSVRLLGLAVLAIVLAPCLIEFGLRIAACRSSDSDGPSTAGVQIVPSWTTHHRLAPLQKKTLARGEGSNSSAAGRAEPVLFRTNSLGLRGREVEVPKPSDVFRIVVLGDESILGQSTDESRTVTARLAHWLQTRSAARIEVVNAGVPDSCPLLAYLHARHALLALQPDLLLVDVNSGDVRDDGRYRRHTELAADGQPLACSHPELSAPGRSRSISENFLVVRHTEQLLAGWLSDPPRDSSRESLAAIPASLPGESAGISEQRLSLTLAPLDDLARLANAVPGGLVLATHPTRSELAREARQDSSTLATLLREISARRGLLLCDSTSAFRKAAKDGSLFLRDGELSGRGHEVYARALAVALVERIAGPWQPARPRVIRQGPESAVGSGRETRLAPVSEQR